MQYFLLPRYPNKPRISFWRSSLCRREEPVEVREACRQRWRPAAGGGRRAAVGNRGPPTSGEAYPVHYRIVPELYQCPSCNRSTFSKTYTPNFFQRNLKLYFQESEDRSSFFGAFFFCFSFVCENQFAMSTKVFAYSVLSDVGKKRGQYQLCEFTKSRWLLGCCSGVESDVSATQYESMAKRRGIGETTRDPPVKVHHDWCVLDEECSTQAAPGWCM